MSRPWKLDEITGSISSRFSSARASTMPPSVSARRDQEPVVRADEDVAPRDLEPDREPFRADSRVDDGHMDADRHVLEREHQRARAPNGSNSAAPGG
jgi:hypothetical protein